MPKTKVVIKYVKSTLCRGLLSVGRTVYLTEVDGKIFEAKVVKVTKSSYEFEWENKDSETETTELSFINENGKDAEDVIVVQHGRILPSDTECDLLEVTPNEADILASHTVCVLIPAKGRSEPARYEQIDDIKYTKDKEVFSCKLVSNQNWVDVRSVYITEKLAEETEQEEEEAAAATTTTKTTKKKKTKKKKEEEEEQQFAEGAWSSDEHKKFESGVVLHGWGKWDAISTNVVKSRSRAQVKSHAQKIQKNHPEEKKKLIEEHTKTTKKNNKPTSKKGAAPKKKTAAPKKKTTTKEKPSKPSKPTRKSSKTSKQQSKTSKQKSSTTLTTNSKKKRKTTAELEKESTDKNDAEDGDEELVKAVSKENDDEQSTPGDSIEHDFILSTLKKNMESLKDAISDKANKVLYDTFEREIKSCENKVVKLTQDVGLLEKIEKGLEALEKAGQALSANRRVVDKNKESRATDLRTKKGKLVEAEEELVAARVRLGINAHNMQECALKLQNILTVRDQNQNIILQPTIDNKYINNDDDDDDETVDGNQTEVLVASVEKGCQNFITKIEEALLERLESIKKDTVDTNFNIGFNKSAKSLRDKKEHYDHLLATANELKDHYKFRSSKKKEEFHETFASTTTAFEADYSRLKIKHKEALDAFDEAVDRLESVAWAQDETLKDILKITIGNISIQLELRDFDEDPIYLANDNEEDSDDDDNNNYDNTERAVR